MKKHLKSEHDMVKYEVEFILHLCLINRKERDEIIKTLGPRLDWFVENGVIEKDINLFEIKESPLNNQPSREKIAKHEKDKETTNDIDDDAGNMIKNAHEGIKAKHSEVIILEVGDIEKVCKVKSAAEVIQNRSADTEILTSKDSKVLFVPHFTDDTDEGEQMDCVDNLTLEEKNDLSEVNEVDGTGQCFSSDLKNEIAEEYFKETIESINDDLDLNPSDDEEYDMDVSFRQAKSMRKQHDLSTGIAALIKDKTKENLAETVPRPSKDDVKKDPIEAELALSTLFNVRGRNSRGIVRKEVKDGRGEEGRVRSGRTRSTAAKEVTVKGVKRLERRKE